MCPDHRSPGRPRTRWWLLAAIAVFVLVPALWVTARGRAEHKATASCAFAIGPDGGRIELGNLGGTYGGASGVNDRDEVVGWQSAPMAPSTAINSRGTVVGTYSDVNRGHGAPALGVCSGSGRPTPR